MNKIKIAIGFALVVGAAVLISRQTVQTQSAPAAMATATPSAPPTATRDLATTNIGGEVLNFPNVAMLVATRGSSQMGFQARALVGCDKSVSKDLKGIGANEFGLASEAGKSIYVCSYSISNAGTPQDVQFITGTEASSGGNHVCNPKGNVSAKFHLSPNQFVTQGSGVGALFSVYREGICLKIYGTGEVGVNITYASF